MSKQQFEEIYEQHFDLILNYAFRRTGDYDLSKDITSEVFMKVYLNLWKFRWRNIPIKSWIYRIATNEINMYFRKNTYRAKMMELYTIDQHLELDQTVVQLEKEEALLEVEQYELFTEVQRCIQSMEIKYQEVLTLRLFEEEKVKAISEIVKKKEGTVKSLISRGLKKLREKTATNKAIAHFIKKYSDEAN